MTTASAAMLFAAALVAGALNSVAGGGSFISFPALLFAGVRPITANATNTIALWPGSVASVGAYRRELRGRLGELAVLGGISLVGGLLGAVLLLKTPERTFVFLIPYLMLTATLLFAFGKSLTARLRQRLHGDGAPSPGMLAGTALVQLVIATYGGYFGGGIGILMLALLALMGMENIHAMNALKTVLQTCINGVAVVTFVVAGAVAWPEAAVMVAGAVIGGFGGAHLAQRLAPRHVRAFVLVVGFGMTAYFFWRTYAMPAVGRA